MSDLLPPDENLSELALTIAFMSLTDPAILTVKRGSYWVGVLDVIPLNTRLKIQVEVLISYNPDEQFYCLGLFCERTTWLHAHISTGEIPVITVISYTKPDLKGL